MDNGENFGFDSSELQILRDKEDNLKIPLVAWLHLVDSYFMGTIGPVIYCVSEGGVIRARPIRLNSSAFVVYDTNTYTKVVGIYLVKKYGSEWFINKEDAEDYLKGDSK